MCFDLERELNWEYGIDSKPISIDLSKDYIVTTSEKWKLYLFDMNGNLKWQRNDCGYSRIFNNHILAGLKLFDIQGNLKWEKEILHVAGLDVSDNYVAFATNGDYKDIKKPYVYLFDIYGELKWKHILYDDIGNDVNMLKILENNVIVATDDFLHVFDLEGNIKLKYKSNGGGAFKWFDTTNKNIVVGSDMVVCLLSEKCDLKWQKIIAPSEFSGRFPVICEDYVFVGTYSGSLYVFDLDGNEIYKEESKDEFGDPLCLFKWNRYLLCTGYRDNIVYLFKIKNQKIGTKKPKLIFFKVRSYAKSFKNCWFLDLKYKN